MPLHKGRCTVDSLVSVHGNKDGEDSLCLLKCQWEGWGMGAAESGKAAISARATFCLNLSLHLPINEMAVVFSSNTT